MFDQSMCLWYFENQMGEERLTPEQQARLDMRNKISTSQANVWRVHNRAEELNDEIERNNCMRASGVVYSIVSSLYGHLDLYLTTEPKNLELFSKFMDKSLGLVDGMANELNGILDSLDK